MIVICLDVSTGVVGFGVSLRVRVVRIPSVVFVVGVGCTFPCLPPCAVSELGEMSTPSAQVLRAVFSFSHRGG